MREDTITFEALLCGKLLGDGYLSGDKEQSRLQFRHSIKDQSYVYDQLHLFSRFLQFGKSNPYTYVYFDKRTGRTYTTLVCQSYQDERLTRLRKIWYSQNRKIVPVNYLYRHFNELSLAIWYQDDGSLKSCRRLILSTESFTAQEIHELRRLLATKFSIESHIDHQQRIDICTRKDVELFLITVRPVLFPSMNRKMLNVYYDRLKQETADLLVAWKKGTVQLNRITNVYLPPFIKNHLQSFSSHSRLLNHILPLKQELELILKPHYRHHRIKLSKQLSAFGKQREPLRLYINDLHLRALRLLKKWTGIEISEYITLLVWEHFWCKEKIKQVNAQPYRKSLYRVIDPFS